MYKLKTCCCFSLKTGAYIVGATYAVGWCLEICDGLISLSSSQESEAMNEPPEITNNTLISKTHDNVRIIRGTLAGPLALVFGMMGVFWCIAYIVALNRKKVRPLKAFMIMNVTVTALEILIMIFTSGVYFHYMLIDFALVTIFPGVLGVACEAYSIWVVYSYYHHLIDENTASLLTVVPPARNSVAIARNSIRLGRVETLIGGHWSQQHLGRIPL